MAIYYVSNENGDWWTIDTATAQGDTLFVISEADLARAVAQENPDEDEIDIDVIANEIKILDEAMSLADEQITGFCKELGITSPF
jgi:hypothetical protein